MMREVDESINHILKSNISESDVSSKNLYF